MTQNIGVFVLWKQENDILDWPSQSPDANPIEKCLGTHEIQAPRKEVLDRQAVISTDLIYGVLCLKFML